jgi:hypothetical protein
MLTKKRIMIIILLILLISNLCYAWNDKSSVSIVEINPVPEGTIVKIKIINHLYNMLGDAKSCSEQLEEFLKSGDIKILYKLENAYCSKGVIRTIVIYYN